MCVCVRVKVRDGASTCQKASEWNLQVSCHASKLESSIIMINGDDLLFFVIFYRRWRNFTSSRFVMSSWNVINVWKHFTRFSSQQQNIDDKVNRLSSSSDTKWLIVDFLSRSVEFLIEIVARNGKEMIQFPRRCIDWCLPADSFYNVTRRERSMTVPGSYNSINL